MQHHPFLESLPVVERFADVADGSRYRPLPEDWLVAVSDVADSTGAIAAGRYKDVNIVGASVIVGCMNAAGRRLLPYAFGGDGALVCLPPELAAPARAVLAQARRIAAGAFGLELRVGLVPVAKLRAAGQEVLAARLRLSELISQTLFHGGGLAHAEALLKVEPMPAACRVDDADAQAAAVDFSGLECRWQEVPGGDRETLALLVKVLDRDLELYRRVLAEIDAIFGEAPHPLREEALRLPLHPAALVSEARLHTFGQGRLQRLRYGARALLQTAAGRWFMGRGHRSAATDWSRYRADLVAHADYRKYDDMLRMVIAGSPEQRRRLEAFLDALRARGRLAYGLHRAPSALITCMVYQYQREHLHFVDGSHGGYAEAARQLKRQLAELAPGLAGATGARTRPD